MPAKLEQTLLSHFGMPQFRAGQKEIITSILAQKDVLAVLPTGGGKSLCYQLPAVELQKLVVVVSPLIALMKDQVASLQRMKIPAGAIFSGQTEDEKRAVFTQIQKGGAYVLYLSPERVQKEGFQRWIQNQNLALFAIDEAHCVSQWGHDFRAEYGELKILKKLRPDVPMLALTASATPTVLDDISKQLQLNKPEKRVHGFYRPNLYFQVEACENEDQKFELLVQAIKQTLSQSTGRILIYCGTRKMTQAVASQLELQFESVSFYHAGLGTETRNQVQADYIEGNIRILVATNAFGMGIDQPDVRLVVHFQMPANIDSLSQEMGRAGRDGLPSTCVMLYAAKDKGLQSYFIQNSEASAELKKLRWKNLDALVNYAEGGECRHAEILIYYKDAQRIQSCGHCDVCAPKSERRVVLSPSQKPSPVQSQIQSWFKGEKAATSFKKAKKSKAPSFNDSQILDPQQLVCFEALKVWRKQKSKELDTPAFIIFSDKTLRQLAQLKPTDTEGLQKVYGIGQEKSDRFGAEIFQVIQSADSH